MMNSNGIGTPEEDVYSSNNSNNNNHGSKSTKLKKSHIRPKTTAGSSSNVGTPILPKHPTEVHIHTNKSGNANNTIEEDDDDDAIGMVDDDLIAHSQSFDTMGTGTDSEYWLDEQTLRTQLWDAYRLARVILGKTISKFTLDSATILHAIRVVAEMKLELIGLHKQVEYYDQIHPSSSSNNNNKATTTVSSASSSPDNATHTTTGSSSMTTAAELSSNSSASALDQQITQLEEQLTRQFSNYQQLDQTHQTYVQETKNQLQDIFTQLHALPKSSVTPKQAADIQVTLQKLIQTVAIASTKPQMEQLRQEIQASQQETKNLQQKLVQLQKDMEAQQHHHAFTLDTARVRYEQQLAVCHDQIAMYQDQVTHQEEELVYSNKNLEELLVYVEQQQLQQQRSGDGASEVGGAGASLSGSPSKHSTARLHKKFARAPSIASVSPSVNTASRVTRIQDNDLTGMLLTLETLVPQLVQSVQKRSTTTDNSTYNGGAESKKKKRHKGAKGSDNDEAKDKEEQEQARKGDEPQGNRLVDEGDDAPGLELSISSLKAPRRPAPEDDDERPTTTKKQGSHKSDHDNRESDNEEGEEDVATDLELETTLELQRQVSTLLRQVAVHQTTRRVTELKIEIAETVHETQKEDEELIHLQKQLEFLQIETKYMTLEQFQEQLQFWQAMRLKYERQLEELKRQVWRKQEIQDLNKKCDELALLAVEMEEFAIIEQDDKDGMGPMLELIQARQEACVTGTQQVQEQIQKVKGDYKDFCHAIEHTLIELQSSTWLVPDGWSSNGNSSSNDDMLQVGQSHDENNKGDDVGELTNLQTKVEGANKLLQLERQLKLRDQELAEAKLELIQSQNRILELEEQVLEQLHIPSQVSDKNHTDDDDDEGVEVTDSSPSKLREQELAAQAKLELIQRLLEPDEEVLERLNIPSEMSAMTHSNDDEEEGVEVTNSKSRSKEEDEEGGQ
jgi:hypothetical protein